MSNESTITHANADKADPLLDALVALTQLQQRPFSAQSLTAGLPLVNGRLTPPLFVRAAEKAGFSSRHVERPLDDISELVLPVALLLTHGNVCILTAFSRETNQAKILFPEDFTKHTAQNISVDELNQLYAGSCLYLKNDKLSESDSGETRFAQHWFWSTIKRSRGIYSEVLVASLLINIFALVSPLFIMNVYDRVVPNYATETLWVLASGVVIVIAFDLLMKSLRGYFIDVAGKRADIILSAKTFSTVMDIKMSERPARVGSFANNLQEFDGFREFFTSTTLVTLIDLPFVLLFVLLIFGIGGSIALVPLIAIPLIILFSFFVQRSLREVITATFNESARKHALLIESLTGLDAIKGARAEGVMQRKWEGFNARLAKLSLKSRLLALITVNFTQVVQQLATVGIVAAGVYAIIDGNLSVGGLIACTILTGRCLTPMAQVAGIFNRYYQSIAAYKAIDRIMSLPVERPDGHKFLHRPDLDGSLEFRNVSFSYPNQQARALADVSFNVRQGERVGIIGKMGSGKTTIQKLMMSFYQPTEGSILVSGTDINQLDPTDLRQIVSYVPQDIMLFEGSIRENIIMSAPLSNDADVLRATKLAGLADFVDQHPEGYDLNVGERGLRLSGGQRQGVAIARALLNQGRLLLLDEPTSGMDNTTESTFIDALAPSLENKTLVLITHKSTMLRLIDRLIVINEGKIVADGPRDQVINALAGKPS
ncbi:MAG: ATP-binding cassette subfamily C protein LapB [Candidatus Azotimanducaceae bacterium]|jgi:ATP-binding cassette subfamily C protein LapB